MAKKRAITTATAIANLISSLYAERTETFNNLIESTEQTTTTETDENGEVIQTVTNAETFIYSDRLKAINSLIEKATEIDKIYTELYTRNASEEIPF